MIAGKLLRSILLLCIAAVTVPAMRAQTAGTCFDGTLNGKYVLNGNGTNVELNLLGLIIAQQHVEDIGYLVFDGNGNVSSGSLDETVDNTSTTSTPSGTYTLLGSCAGTLTLTINGTQRHYQLSSPLAPGMDGTGVSADFYLSDSDGGTDISLHGTKTFDPAGGCSTDILGGDVAVGDEHGGIANTNVSNTAKIVFNADGTFALTESGSTNGTISSFQHSGTYAVQTDCSVKLFADAASGGFQVGQLQLDIPQPALTNASLQKNLATSPITDKCQGCHADMQITWEPYSGAQWAPPFSGSGSTSGEFTFGPSTQPVN